jgi:hypothetical protein
VLLTVLSLGNVLNAGFDQVFNLYNPLVYSTGDIIDTWVYRTGLLNLQYELATAVGFTKIFGRLHLNFRVLLLGLQVHQLPHILTSTGGDGMVRDTTIRSKAFDILLIFILALITLTCILPLWYTLALSLSSNTAAAAGKVCCGRLI